MPGRHAMPSAPTRPMLRAGIVAAAAVTGPLAITGTAMAAPSVSLDSNATWDRLAMCESTQNWDADTGNGWSNVLRMREVMLANGDGGKKIWMTEIGAPTCDCHDGVSQVEQAKQINDVLAAAAGLPPREPPEDDRPAAQHDSGQHRRRLDRVTG